MTTFSHLQLPTIRFGRQIDRQTGADFYAVLNKSDSFPADAEKFFRETLCKSVQWESGAAERRCDNAFLFWKFNAEQILAAQISDAGNDLRGRPHSLQIVAVLIDTKTFAEIIVGVHSSADVDALLFAGLPNVPQSFHSNAENGETLNETIRNFLKNPKAKNLLIADVSSIIHRNIEILFDVGKTTTEELPLEKKYYYQEKHRQNKRNMPRTFSNRTPKTPRIFFALPMILSILVIALSVVFARQYGQLRQLRRDFQQLEQSREELIRANSSLEQEMREIRRQILQQNKELAELQTQREDWQKEKTSFEEQNRRQENQRKADRLEFEQKLIDARKNAQQSLLDENERLRKESVQNNEILNEIEQLIKKRRK
ncbi:MAG: hypothetical protein LBT05_12780 [Planctomycetaceae bacterium]|jgi:hypothetical protein|nr:hypothetical protein [Planctomycetaceae bacterium]